MRSPCLPMLAAATAALLTLAGGEKSFGLPSLPGVPPVPSANQAAKGIVSNELLKQFGVWFNANRPVYISGNDVLPTVRDLPGGAFRPASFAATRKLFTAVPNGVIRMPAGDYNVTVVTYCMGHFNQGPWRNKFLLAPIKGAWSDIAVALNYRAFSSRFTPPQVQVLSWSLQAGMDYQEMGSGSKQIVDALLPDYKSRLQGDFYDRARDEWNSIASKVPGAPSFESALGQLGPIGTTLAQLRQARDTIISDGNNFNALVAQFSRLGQGRVPNPIADTPWSVIAPGVYARLRTKGTLLTQGVVQIRVTAQAATKSFDVASEQLRGIGAKRVAFDLPFPFTNWGGFFNGPTQPLSWSPEPNNAPDPSQSDGGSDGGSSPSHGHNGGGNPGGNNNGNNSGNNNGNNGGNNNGNNNGNNGDNNGDNSGGSGGGNGSNQNSNGSNENNGNDFDTSTPCDPPGNVFGVQQGTMLSASSTNLTVGRGKGNGVVCLLLRPYVSMAPLGWPERGTGSVDDGSVSYSLPGNPAPGHVVIYAHYTYATSSNIIQLYVKHQVTAVIDYSGVSPFCPELAQTLALHANPLVPNWLSGAELENRLCITGMVGPTIVVRAWVVDGTAVNKFSLNHPVDPQNFLYEDAWNHM